MVWLHSVNILGIVQVNALAFLVLDYFPNLHFLVIMNYPILNRFFCICQPKLVSVSVKADWQRVHSQVANGNYFLESTLWLWLAIVFLWKASIHFTISLHSLTSVFYFSVLALISSLNLAFDESPLFAGHFVE